MFFLSFFRKRLRNYVLTRYQHLLTFFRSNRREGGVGRLPILETLIIKELQNTNQPSPHLAGQRIITIQQRGQTGALGGTCV